MSLDGDPTKWVDEWPIPGLSTAHRKRIKSQLLKAHATFHRNYDVRDPYSFQEPVRQAFDAVARVLFEAGLLTAELLENQLRLLIVEAAIAGGWIPYDMTGLVRTDIFPGGFLGYAPIWERFREAYFPVFLADTAEWKSRLMDTEAASEITPAPPAPEPPGLSETETLGEQLDRLRKECRFTVEELAEKVGLDPTSVHRHLADKSVPHLSNLGAYERVFSKKLGRKIVIEKTPVKRQ